MNMDSDNSASTRQLMARLNIETILIETVPGGAQGGTDLDVTYVFKDSPEEFSVREFTGPMREALEALEEHILHRKEE